VLFLTPNQQRQSSEGRRKTGKKIMPRQQTEWAAKAQKFFMSEPIT